MAVGVYVPRLAVRRSLVQGGDLLRQEQSMAILSLNRLRLRKFGDTLTRLDERIQVEPAHDCSQAWRRQSK